MAGTSRRSEEEQPAASFGTLLRLYRRRAGLTQEDLAERSSVSARTISDLERGLKPGPHRTTVRLLAVALDLSAEERAALEGSRFRPRQPLRAASPGHVPRAPAPEPLTSLVGRRRDVEEVVHRLRWGGIRLLTLTGAGGVGKTRVALACVRALGKDRPGAPVFVGLAPLRSADLVGPAISHTLGMPETDNRSAEDRLISHFREREAILVLDNFEHVLGASPLLAALLRACPRLKLLVTSRTALRLQGEHRMELAPLEVPESGTPAGGESAAGYPAVELFVQRARAVRRDFTVTEANLSAIVEICRRLDGLPLAIELAAARVSYLSPHAVLMRLGSRLPLLTGGPVDLPPRQQTMRDAIAWSYDLLDEPRRVLFRRLAVFAGGWDLEAAETVCAGDDAGFTVVDSLGALADASLVLAGEEPGEALRFQMLETIREYAGELLEASGEQAALRRHHAEYYLTCAEEADAHLSGPQQASWLDRLARESDNLRAALAWAAERGEIEIGCRLCVALRRFWSARGRAQEGLRWMHRFLPVLEQIPAPALQADLLYAAGALSCDLSLLDEARAHFERSLSLARQVGDPVRTGIAVNGLSVVASNVGAYDEALAGLREAAALYREAGAVHLLGAPLNNIANIVRYRGQTREAIDLYEECLAIYRQIGNIGSLASTLKNLALVLDDTGDPERAEALTRESLELYVELDDPIGRAQALTTLGSLALDRGENERARALFGEALELARSGENTAEIGLALTNLGLTALRRSDHEEAESLLQEGRRILEGCDARRLTGYAFTYLGDLARARSSRPQARVFYERSLQVSRQIGHLAGIADGLENLASLDCEEGAWQSAARGYGAAAALRTYLDMPVPRLRRQSQERDYMSMKEALGEEGWATAWSEGTADTQRLLGSA